MWASFFLSVEGGYALAYLSCPWECRATGQNDHLQQVTMNSLKGSQCPLTTGQNDPFIYNENIMRKNESTVSVTQMAFATTGKVLELDSKDQGNDTEG